MPAIKKRITAEYLEREQQRGSEQNGRGAGDLDEENLPPAPPPAPLLGSSPLKRKAPTGAHLLKGLDGEVLVEKRKRTLPPAELKLEAWLDENLEKKAESTLSVMKLYQFYTDMCQQDATNVVEMEVFRHMLKNKFGKEFGLKDNSPYMGLLKESKPRKKPVVAPSLGYKMKDLIQEALKASGNPMKGVMFAWVKKFIAGKYPALQIELRPHFLRSALEREIYAGKVELVKGIGFCGFYRLPGPPDVEEDPAKAKKKGGKKAAKGEEGGESADDSADKEGEESDKSQEKTEDSAAEQSDDKQKKEGEESVDDTEEGKDAKGDDKKEDKKAKKKKKRPAKPRRMNGPRHGHPQTINDIFPLAMTYMAEPKEASFGRIRKYLEKYYGKTDIDVKLKKCMEHGCDTGMWDRVSGSGASGSFQLQVDSFNPEHTESLTDMVCSAIIACTEPKVSSVRLLKSYISEYHPEFNIDTRPIKLRNALERAEKYNQLRRISGIGMSGSFQLVEQFTPSPAVLAGEEDEEQEEDEAGDPGTGKEEVYVVRQTKSGRRAPIDRTQLDFSSTYKKKAPAASAARSKMSNSRRQPAAKKGRQAEESSEEEEESSEEEEEEEKSYTPRPTKSRGRSAPPPKKSAAKPPAAKARSQAAKSREGSRGSSRAESALAPAKKARPPPAKSPRRPPPAEVARTEVKKPNTVSRSPPVLARKSAPAPNPPAKGARLSRAAEPEEEEDEEDEKLLPAKRTPTKRARPSRAAEPEEEEEEEDDRVTAAKRTSAKRSPAKRARPSRAPEPEEEEEEEENYYEVEEASPPPKRGGARAGEEKAMASAKRASAKRARPSRAEEEEENDYEIEEEEITPPAKRGGGGRVGGAKSKAAASGPKRGERRAEVAPFPVVEARTPRSASRSARKSLKEVDSDEEFDEEEEYVARPTLSRGGKKR